ncbi:hypothetical protein JOQ06_014798, partial [Pogonophryne albipinna]
MMEIFCDFCSHADSDCERLQESSDRTLCRDSKSVLDRINQSDCVGLRLLLTVETKTTQPEDMATHYNPSPPTTATT